MTESIYLELQNGALFFVASWTLLVFMRYAYVHFGMGYRFLQASIALGVIWLSQVIVRGPLWWARYLTNSGKPQEIPDLFITVGTIIGVIGFLCVIRVFSSEKWHAWGWRLCFLGLLLFLGVSYFKLLPPYEIILD